MEAMLPPEWDAQLVYDHHEVLMLHGQKTCHFRNPACGRCVLLELCPTGQARRAGVGLPQPVPEASGPLAGG
jgi:endonuclease-3